MASVSGRAYWAGGVADKPIPGYKEALKGRICDRDLLDTWLTDTIAVAPKAQMVYFQDDPKARAKLIRYLESLK